LEPSAIRASIVPVNVHDLIADVTNAVQALAIIVGAIWAYYKFFRGRVFASRAQLDATGELLGDRAHPAVRVHITLRNTGVADINLRLKVLYVYRATEDGWDDGPRWEQLTQVHVLLDDDRLEGGDAVTDDVLVPVPANTTGDAIAYRARCVVYERRRKPGVPYWAAEAIIPRANPVSPGPALLEQEA
jgi:hypothetical protein